MNAVSIYLKVATDFGAFTFINNGWHRIIT